jgi:hypothetical protein
LNARGLKGTSARWLILFCSSCLHSPPPFMG